MICSKSFDIPNNLATVLKYLWQWGIPSELIRFARDSGRRMREVFWWGCLNYHGFFDSIKASLRHRWQTRSNPKLYHRGVNSGAKLWNVP